MYYKISRFILAPTSGKPSTTADIFIANPQIDQEAILGKLFFLSEIESTKPDALKIINFFISALPAYYYQSEKISLREKMGMIKISDLFETALGKINAEFENFIKKEKIKIEPKAINLITGVVYKNELTFSATGKIKAWLIYPEKEAGASGADKKTYQISNVEEQAPEENKTHLNKIFFNITEGKIPPEGYFVFSNEIFPEYVNNRHLAKVITTLPPVSAVEYLKNQLHKINSYVTFLALIIKSSATPPVKCSIPQMQLNITANNSLERMNETENATEKYLSPVGLIPVNRYWGIIKNIWSKIIGGRERKLTTIIRDKVFFVKKHRLNFYTKIGGHVKIFFLYLFNIIAYLLRLLSRPRELTNKLSQVSRSGCRLAKSSFFNASRWFFNLSIISKVLLFIFIACSLLFCYSLYNLRLGQNEQVEQQSYQDLSQQLTQKQNQIEASLLYHNEEKAKEFIDETAALIEKLRQFKNIDQKLIDKFAAVNAEQTAKISHVIAVDSPVELINFNKLNLNAAIVAMVAANGRVYASDLNNQTVYEFNPSEKTANSLKSGVNDIDYGALWQNNQVIFLSAGGGITIDDKNNITDFTKSLANSKADVTAAASYNSRLYLLSAAQNNIFRYTRDFSSREPWIKENIDVKNAISFDVDGYVYLLKNNGEVIKLLSGYVNEFKLSGVNPALANPQKIRLTGDSEKGLIYVLEPAQRRLVVFEKSGQFLLQYKLPTLTNLKDFAVLEKEKKILLLNDAAVYEIKTEELK
ncbi:hypothetical protein COU00_02185 [Candidatus Falkowbacteria bacterium CG10_big_fil_rev_8_21_14_0_10_43_11]|uniref:Uncharacterized protein n=1 Tax=Candidatus Falkowbacteria bacterium CG10_big_fil_rev_8_21_14_0_10_43_11 TaxID=1974568 RepID=A0A2M6WM33_9BACT|nr:MAG: hypothetical protein COU00_02185 [Candidatus Falkowbacteria bacterium CG10_big_fil_rev_8_21_14_0_10_43_11]